jgi:hypothetical protein
MPVTRSRATAPVSNLDATLTIRVRLLTVGIANLTSC